MQQARASDRRRPRQMPGSQAIHTPGRIDLGLGAVHRSVSGRIDDDRRALCSDRPLYGLFITDIQLCTRQAHHRHIRGSARQQAAADLTLRAGDQHLQG